MQSVVKDPHTGPCIQRAGSRGGHTIDSMRCPPPSLDWIKLSLISQEMRIMMLKSRMRLIFGLCEESRRNTDLPRICSSAVGLQAAESGLHSVPYKEGLWKGSAAAKRNVLCLWDFLPPRPQPLCPQRQVFGWKDICAFFFLFKTECHDLGHTNVISTLTACWFISRTCSWRKERQNL